MPKLLICAGGGEFFQNDDSYYYWTALKGDKYIRSANCRDLPTHYSCLLACLLAGACNYMYMYIYIGIYSLTYTPYYICTCAMLCIYGARCEQIFWLIMRYNCLRPGAWNTVSWLSWVSLGYFLHRVLPNAEHSCAGHFTSIFFDARAFYYSILLVSHNYIIIHNSQSVQC